MTTQDDKLHSVLQQSFTDDEEIANINRENQSFKAFDAGVQISGTPMTSELLTRLKEKVYEVRPNFGQINKESGNLPFFEYTKRHAWQNRNKSIKKRKPEISSVLFEETRRLLGSAIAASLEKQLKDNDGVSTIQHSGPLSHPYVLSSTLQNSLPYFGGDGKPQLQNILVLSCASISFNNYKYPKGHLLHTFQNGIETHQLPLFGHTADARPVIHHKPYTPEAITDIKKRIYEIQRDDKLTKEATAKLVDLFEDVYASPHALSQNEYHDQLTVTNYWLFKKIFSSYPGFVPSLIFLSQEKITLRLLEMYHLYHTTTIQKILFDKTYEPLIYKYFNGLNGAFDREKNYGTYFFWGLPKGEKYRVQLWKQGEYLVSSDNTFKIAFTPEGIYQAIQHNQLIPNTLLTFMLLSFYYGLILGGGPAQTLNLTTMKKAYMSMMEETKDAESMEASQDTETRNLVISRPSMAFIETGNDIRVPATGTDIYLYGDAGKKSWPLILQATKTVTLDEIMNRTLPSFYAEFCPPTEKEQVLSAITERDIEKLTQLDQKIPAWVKSSS